LQLIPTILREKPDLAVSHCSRSQLIASTILQDSIFFLGDYEFATGWIFIYPTWHMRPEVIPDGDLPMEPESKPEIPWYQGRRLMFLGSFRTRASGPNSDSRKDMVVTIAPAGD